MGWSEEELHQMAPLLAAVCMCLFAVLLFCAIVFA